MTPGWPAVIKHGSVGLRPLKRRDASSWARLRRENAEWLNPWDGTLPPEAGPATSSTGQMIASLRAKARQGLGMPFVITSQNEKGQNEMVGMLSVGSITWGSARSAGLGYWIAKSHAGRGITTAAVAMVCDHLFFETGLHRVDVQIRPENVSSLRVVEKLGFTEVGLAPRYIHIAGQWRDHRLFQLVSDDVSGRVIERL